MLSVPNLNSDLGTLCNSVRSGLPSPLFPVDESDSRHHDHPPYLLFATLSPCFPVPGYRAEPWHRNHLLPTSPPFPMSTSTPTPRRRLTTEKLARRKRAVAACQFCRLRKTKCDGVKPVCGFCQRLDAQCIWSDHSLENRYESTPAEHEILQRLDELKALLQNSNAVLPGSSTVEGAANASSEPPARPPSPTTAASYPSNLSSVSPSIPSNASARCESMLHWPVFRESLEPSEIAIESFVLEDDHFFDTSPSSFTPTLSGPPKKLIASAYGLQENHFVPLCRKFLVHVHPRNPILEGGELMQYAKRAAEDGLGWDGPSCLVVG